jgi:hypothetical protein
MRAGSPGASRDATNAQRKYGTQRGEDVVKDEGKEPARYDLSPQGQSQRPAGESTSRAFTGVDPQETITEDSSADQAG